MENSSKLQRLGVFMSVGYISAGTLLSIFGGIPLWTDYLGASFVTVSLSIIGLFIVGATCGILLVRFLVPRAGAKAVYEQDILIYMIGMLFVALTINKAMFVVGLFVISGALAVYFYENFNRQLIVARQARKYFIVLAGWATGPIVSIIALQSFSEYGLLTVRILYAHYIALAFWVWIQRLAMHEDYKDASSILFGKKTAFKVSDKENVPATTVKDEASDVTSESEDKSSQDKNNAIKL